MKVVDITGFSQLDWDEKVKVDLKDKADKILSGKKAEIDIVYPVFASSKSLNKTPWINKKYPTNSPFLKNSSSNEWKIGMQYSHKNLGDMNVQIQKDLAGAVEHLDIKLDEGLTSFGNHQTKSGAVILSQKDLKKVFTHVYLNMVSISIDSGLFFENVWNIYVDYNKEKHQDFKELSLDLGIDIVKHSILAGLNLKEDQNYLSKFADIISQKKIAKVQGPDINIDLELFHSWGLDNAHQIAYALNALLENIRAYESHHKHIEALNVQFTIGSGPRFFLETAKIRALKYLLKEIAKNIPYQLNFTYKVVSSALDHTLYDPWVNILRGSTAAFVGALAGVDIVTIRPFDYRYDRAELGHQIARNAQNIIKEESHLDKVNDPLAGSYFVESLTHQLIQKSWPIFQKVEKDNGLLVQLVKGKIQKAQHKQIKKDLDDYAKRKKSITGLNQFPKLDEVIVNNIDSVGININELLSEFDIPTYQGPEIKDLAKITSYGQEFEAIRNWANGVKKEKGSLPRVQVLHFSDAKKNNARIMFLYNCLNIAGFEYQEVTLEQVNPKLSLCLCATDKDYESHLEEIRKIATNHTDLYLAGVNKWEEESLNKIQSIAMGTNLIELSKGLQAFYKKKHLGGENE